MGTKTQTAHLGTSKAYELRGAASGAGCWRRRAVQVYCCAMRPDARILHGTQALAVSGTDGHATDGRLDYAL
jgi:hypothetical protein